MFLTFYLVLRHYKLLVPLQGVRLGAWVLVPLQGAVLVLVTAGAAAGCHCCVRWELLCWCRCRVPLLRTLASLGAGAAAGCRCGVRMGGLVLVPLQGVRLGAWVLVPLQGAAAVCAWELGRCLGAWVLEPLQGAATLLQVCCWCCRKSIFATWGLRWRRLETQKQPGQKDVDLQSVGHHDFTIVKQKESRCFDVSQKQFLCSDSARQQVGQTS